MKFIALLLALLSIASAEKWAVLVSGSNYYWNYRHQADVAHAYHILIQNGYKPENVIVFSSNDCVYDKSNPFPGALYNHPGDDSINYYEGLVTDYEGEKATPENYLKVLSGDETAGGKVLKTTAEDTIFLAYFDHGGPDIVAFPAGGYLYRDYLEETILEMKSKKMYKKIVYYMEACYSGSMFVGFEEGDLIYALTAANPHESSYEYYCEDEAVVKGVNLGTCLGDEFSVHWMENVDEGNLNQTFKEHAEYLVDAVKLSHVSKFGDMSFQNEPISEVFEGDLAHLKVNRTYEKTKGVRGNIYLSKLNFYKRQMTTTNSRETQMEYYKELDLINRVDKYFEELVAKMKKFGKIVDILPIDGPIHNMDCYRKSIDYVESKLSQSDYMMKYFPTLASMCEQYNETPAYL